MSNAVAQIDSSSLDRALSNIDRELKGGVILKSMQEGAKVLREQTRDALIRKMGESATRRSQKRNYQAVDGITVKTDKAYSEVKVSIMGDFRLKWWELGTALRYTKGKGRYRREAYRGKISAKGFFREARANEAPVMEAITQSVSRQLKKYMQ